MKLKVVKSTAVQDLKFIEFNTKIYPRRKSANTQANFKLNQKLKDAHLIALDNDEIVGQIILLPTSCFYSSKKFDCVFAYDYIVHPDYLNTGVGVKLLHKTIKEHIHFGIGVSPVSRKLHLVLKEKYIGEVRKYLFTKNILSYFYAALSTYLKFDIRKIPSTIRWLQSFQYNSLSARRTFFISSHNFVLKSDIIEFSRDSEFMKIRFQPFKNNYSFYQIFDGEEIAGYFILRVELWRGMRVLIISDYRFNGDTEIIDFILNISKKILRNNNLDSVLFGSSLKIIDERLIANSFKKVGLPSEIFTNLPLESGWETKAAERDLIFATPADSDFEFNLGEQLWKK